VHDGFVINALRDDLTVHDAGARLWPQCERLKAALLAATITGEQKFWTSAQAAASGIRLYLDTACRDCGSTRARPMVHCAATRAGSTFYHLVSAIAALDRAAGAGYDIDLQRWLRNQYIFIKRSGGAHRE